MIEYFILGLFFALLGVLLYAEAVENVKIRYVCMSTLMPLLILYYYASVPFASLNWLIVVALIFGYFGDLFLMFRRDDFFIYGLGSFLVGHLFYIIAFLLSIDSLFTFPVWGLLFIIPSVPIILIVVKRTKGKLGKVKMPTYVYMGVIFLMGLCSVLRFASFTSISFYLVWIGANLFMLSDGMIALNKFDKKIPYGEVWIKLTYVLAQFFIAQGFILG